MNALFVILTVLIILAAILLIVVVLLQNGKGEGMASNFVAGNQTDADANIALTLGKQSLNVTIPAASLCTLVL